ncbi:helix-turn-helix domain-containing protein [Bradyrhizobium brasilense]|uniref:helix-turn-helix domain-containing protein n=1 Tax=Bradyrhizobium brasilense TaxID=1419277 RepID=UPI00287788B3|nr:helix-turn-helix domain-containing protein [Bradyrhizobium brasilense]
MIGGASDRYRVLVARAEAIAAGDAEEMTRIPAICHQLSVSQRTLRKAFRSVYGQSPCRRIRVLRLNQARQALLAVNGETAKVTEIAICFGFFELGRFSVEYRKLFGESPSQTLRAAGRDSEMSHDGRAGLRNVRIDYQNPLSRAFSAGVMDAVQDRDVESV